MKRLAIVAALVTAAGPARAADLSPADLQKATSAAKVTLAKAVDAARTAVTGGLPFKAKIDIKANQVIYSVKLFAGESRKTARVDAITGTVTAVDDVTMTAERKEEMTQLQPMLAAAKLDLARAAEAAARAIGGQVHEADADIEGGKLVYEVVLLGKGGLIEAEVDDATGTVGKITQVPLAPGAAPRVFNFDKDAVGGVPDGWKIEGTGQVGPLPLWDVIWDVSAPSAPNVLALSAPNSAATTFNMCWTDRVPFQDGSIEVAMRAPSGDQGGGLVWRVKDHDNYYVCRANPLEGNLRLYVVKDGIPTQLASADIDIPSGTWHTLRIDQRGQHITCSFNGRKLLEADEPTFNGPGGVGLWTKSDPSSWRPGNVSTMMLFDDLKVSPAGK